ncbi:hypothetical protein KX816_11995 [Sphingosinicellaceae bacterium]|nr:hypothetical protein KX816_11995 [Sphingosinicellaceae bacterium]
MTRTLAFAAAFAVALGGMSAPAIAAPCKDAKGKFMKCPPAPAARCRKDGKFAKCGTPGAVPVAAKK